MFNELETGEYYVHEYVGTIFAGLNRNKRESQSSVTEIVFSSPYEYV